MLHTQYWKKHFGNGSLTCLITLEEMTTNYQLMVDVPADPAHGGPCWTVL